MNLLTTTLGLSLAPLLFSTQAQASQVAVPIASAQSLKMTQTSGRRGLSPDEALRLKADVSKQLMQLFAQRQKLERAIAKMQDAIDKGEYMELPEHLIQAAKFGIEMGEVTISMANASFGSILTAERVACRPALMTLQDDTIKSLVATIVTMKKIPELSKQMDIRKKAVVVIDENRIASALNSDKIVMKAGMTREEKRRFILSHAS
ncbi:TPA: hypothetical protein ACIJO6_001524 [Klebsiella aerogenes]